MIYHCQHCDKDFEFDEDCIITTDDGSCSPFASMIIICGDCARGDS